MLDKKQLFDLFSNLPISEMDDIIDELNHMRRTKFAIMYETVHVYPGEIIADKITRETGFHCYHKPVPDYAAGRGTHVIVIPVRKYSEELAQKLMNTYDHL